MFDIFMSVLLSMFAYNEQEFVKSEKWAHIDIAGVMECHGELPFLDKGMSGKYFFIVTEFILLDC